MTKIFLTTEIPQSQTAASKARQDVLTILAMDGYQDLYLPRKMSVTNIFKFWRQLSGMAKGKTSVVIEYPCWQKKRMYVVYILCRLKGIKLYGIIHDIAALRFQISHRRDMAVLGLFNGLVSHNYSMSAWLRQKGYKGKIVDLNAFDYLLDTPKDFHAPALTEPFKLFYAGNLEPDKAAYIYDKKMGQLSNVTLSVYGPAFNQEKMNGSPVRYEGMFDPNSPDLAEDYHFGLIWEGTSVETCEGTLGEYTKFNNPHKLSLYLSLGLPVIVWKEAAIAKFVTEYNIGTTVARLSELSDLNKRIDANTYQQYLKNISGLSQQVRKGYFLTSALKKLINS
jgi:hypothetical protein